MTPLVFTILICLIIVELAILIAFCNKKTKCNCNRNPSPFSNMATLSSEDIDNIWALTGCPNKIDATTKDRLLLMREKDVRKQLSLLSRYYWSCGKTPGMKCAHKDILAPAQYNELLSMWTQHPTCKRNPFPHCYLNTKYKGLTYPLAKERFVRFMNSACPEEEKNIN